MWKEALLVAGELLGERRLMGKWANSTCVAVAGDNFAVIAADTRISDGYSICTRSQTKVIQLYVFRSLGASLPCSHLSTRL